MKHLINWVEIPVTNLERAMKFYSSLYSGVEFYQMQLGEITYALFPCEDTFNCGALAKGEYYKPSTDGTVIYLNGGTDLNLILSQVSNAGGQILMEETFLSNEAGYIAMFIDSEGNKIGLQRSEQSIQIIKEDIKVVAQRLTEAHNEKNMAEAATLLSEDFVSHFAGLPLPMKKQDYLHMMEQSTKAFSDYKFTIDDVLAEGDRVVIRLTMRGKHTGEFMGIPATNKTIEVTGITIRKIKEGKIIEEWHNNDMFGMMQQLNSRA